MTMKRRATTLTATLPRSEMVYPPLLIDRFKYHFWKVYTPLHPAVRDLALAIGIVSNPGRQEFLIGKIATGFSAESVIGFLVANGFGNHFVAYQDEGELAGLRRVDGFAWQYHIRLFKDGEIRGHYEYTPECYPILHMKRVGRQDKTAEFREILREMVVF
jgi:hypothetical protein